MAKYTRKEKVNRLGCVPNASDDKGNHLSAASSDMSLAALPKERILLCAAGPKEKRYFMA